MHVIKDTATFPTRALPHCDAVCIIETDQTVWFLFARRRLLSSATLALRLVPPCEALTNTEAHAACPCSLILVARRTEPNTAPLGQRRGSGHPDRAGRPATGHASFV